MAIAAGFPPHAISVNFRQSSTYIAHDFLAPIEILLARLNSQDPLTREVDSNGQWRAQPSDSEIASALAAIKARVPGATWEVIYRRTDSTTWPGQHVWALPRANQIIALVYRRDLFQKAGLDPAKPPETWDQLREYAQRLTDPARGQYGFMFPSGANMSWGMYSLLVSNGGRMVAMQDGKWRAAYDTTDAAEAVYFFRSLIKQPFTRDGRTINGCALLNTESGDWYRPWVQGRIGMMFEYLSDEMAGSANPQLIGIAPVPKSPKGIRGSELNCPMLGVFSNATPQQQLAVMRYVWFVTSDRAKQIRTRVYVENGFGAFVAPDLLRKFGYNELLKQSPKGWQEAFDAALSGGVPEPYGGNTQSIYRWMSEAINRALELPLDNVPSEQAVSQIRSVLSASTAEVNSKLMGQISADQRRARGFVGTAVALVLIIVFALAMWRSWQVFGQRSGAPDGRRSQRLAIMLVLPSLAMIFFWQYLPLAGGLGISLSRFELVSHSRFVGVDNFSSALFDTRFWASLLRTFYFVLLTIALGFWPPILLAILLQEVPTAPGKYFFRVMYFLPAIISGVIIMFLWAQLYQPNEHGALNRLLLCVNAIGPIPATLIKCTGVALGLALIAFLAGTAIRLTSLSILSRIFAAALAVALVMAGVVMIHRNGLSVVFGSFHVESLRWTHSPILQCSASCSPASGRAQALAQFSTSLL
jgi:multiple sugar transport system permease protein